MSANATSTRRDPRYELRRGTSFVQFPEAFSDALGERFTLIRISVAGLAFEVPEPPNLATGTIIKEASITVGECRIEGDLVIRSIEMTRDNAAEVGCLFYPEGRGSADRLMALLAGIQAGRAGV